jgi:hypothetical protein
LGQNNQIVDATVFVNNEQVVYTVGSFKYKEGLGESTVKPQSVGGGQTINLFSENLESKIGEASFELAPTVDNITLARKWKVAGSANVIQFYTENADGDVKKTITGAALTEDYEVTFGQDASFSLKFMGNPTK